jgi:hypothetical protein
MLEWYGTSGTATAPITIDASAATMQRAAPASDSAQTAPLVDIVGANYVTWNGGTVVGMKGRGDYKSADNLSLIGDVNISGATGTGVGDVIQNMAVQHAANNCIKLEDDESFVTIQNNTLTDCGVTTLEHGIYISGGHDTAQYNTISGTSGLGIQAYQTSNVAVTYDNIIGNTIGNTAAQCIYVGDGGGQVSQNVCQGQSIEIWAKAADQTVTQNVIENVACNAMTAHQDAGVLGRYVVENNTIYNVGCNGVGAAGSGSVLTLIAENNIFANPAQAASAIGGGAVLSSGSVVDYNDYYNISQPSSPGSHSITNNPQLVNPGTDLHLQAGSPAVESGTNSVGLVDNGMTVDDMGRYESPDGIPTPSPTTAPSATDTPTSTPTDTPQPTATDTPTSTPTATSAPSAPTNLVVNGGFESGSSGWALGGSPTPVVTTQKAHSGTHSALLGQRTLSSWTWANNSVVQTVTLPSSASSITLSFWYYLTCSGSQGIQVSLVANGVTTTILRVCGNTNGWTKFSYNLLPYRGKQLKLVFAAAATRRYTYCQMFLDDVSVLAT